MFRIFPFDINIWTDIKPILNCRHYLSCNTHKCTHINAVSLQFSNVLWTITVVSKDFVIILDSNYKLHLVDLNEMVIARTYQGFAGSDTVHLSNPKKEIFCLSKYCFNLKVLDYETGKTKCIIKTGEESHLERNFVVSAIYVRYDRYSMVR